MRSHPLTAALVGATCVMLFTSSLKAQTWSPEQREVWAVVEDSWQAIAAKDHTWVDRLVHPKGRVWSNNYPMPRDHSSQGKWERYGAENSRTLVLELSPVAIVVQGNTAVAHYYYSQAMEDRKGDRKTEHGRYTDVLVRDGGQWKFLAWSGGESSTDDD